MVSTARVTKLYPRLTPRERLQMLGSAIRRGDAIEESRLRESAPSVCIYQSDFADLASTLRWCVYIQRMMQAGYAADFWQASARLAWASDPIPREEGDDADFWRAVADISEAIYAINRDGWRLFLDEGGIDLEVLADPARKIGPVDALDYMDEIATVPADIEETMRALLRRDGATWSKSVDMITPKDVAAGWHSSLRQIQAMKG